MKLSLPLKLAAIGLFLYACTPKKRRNDGSAPMPASDTPLQLWVHSAELMTPIRRAADRITRASGIRFSINEPGTLTTSIPIFLTDYDLCNPALENKGGVFVRCGPGAGYIVVARNCGTESHQHLLLTHELMHALGVGHLGADEAGIMREDGGSGRITEADLNALCEANVCSKFEPEP